MPVEIRMPELSSDMTEADLVSWLVKPGDHVQAGELIAEIETEKSTVEFEAPSSGTLVEIVVAAGTNAVEVGTVIALFEPDDADAPEPPAEPEPPTEPEPSREAAAPEAPAGASAPSGPPATALARRLASRSGVDLDTLDGSGEGGRILKADVEAATGAAAPASAAPSTPTGVESELASSAVPLSRMRRTIATRLAEAKQTIPHFYLSVECEIDAVLEMRSRFNAEGHHISINDFVVRAAALALAEVPDANVRFGEDELIRYERSDVAVAVATDEGLITPVVREADRKELVTISEEVRDLAARARAGRLHPREYQGGSFTVSNLGMYGIDSVYPIVNPPQSCILGVGAGKQKPVVRGGELAVGTVMVCTLSADHRAVDGAVGARLLTTVKQLLEDPLGMLL